MFLYSCHILFYGTNKKNVLQKEIEDLTFEVSDLSTHFFKKSFPIRDQTFMTSTQRKCGEVLQSVTCLQILLFLNNRCTAHFCWWRVGGWGVVCGRHNCMIPNIKTYFDKKHNILITFLALVSVLQWNSHPHSILNICMFKMKSNLKYF